MNKPLINTDLVTSYGLPEEVKTKAGFLFNPNLGIWKITDGVITCDFNFELLNLSDNCLNSLKLTLIWYLEYRSVAHAKNLLERFLAFNRFLNKKVQIIAANDLLNYKTHLAERQGWYLGTLAGLLRKWHDLMLPGVSEDAISLLKDLRIKGNLKGEAVLTMDPDRGPFTELEIQSIHRGLARLFESGALSREDYCLAWLFLAFGMRPVQYAGMKVCDVWKSLEGSGSDAYIVRIPRAKQRENPRSLFLERKVPHKIGLIFESHIEELKKRFSEKLIDIDAAPLFPRRWIKNQRLEGFEFHSESIGIANRIERIIDSLDVVSERTGKKIAVSATRFRRTVGTRAAEEGHGELIIAEILDHKDTQNVGVYVESTPAIVDRIDKALALKIAPLAQAFKGVLIATELQAKRGNDPESRICGPKETGGFNPVGNCGSYGFCGQLAPISCYTCSNFQPWLDGPHEKVLEHLLQERNRLLGSSDSRIASINDQTLLAVAQVVTLCQKQLGNKDE